WLSAMRCLGAVVAGRVGAAAGWFVTGALAAWIAGLYGMSDSEGKRGMFAALFVGPIGGLFCLILAVWGARRIGKGRGRLGARLGRTGLLVAGIAAIVGDRPAASHPQYLLQRGATDARIRAAGAAYSRTRWHQPGGRPRSVSSDGGCTALAS